MSWKSDAHKIYEARVVADSIARLAKCIDLQKVLLSDEELEILATRARESFRRKKKERFIKYVAHLSANYGEGYMRSLADVLCEINNEIGFEEK